jgi:hypothetical protein
MRAIAGLALSALVAGCGQTFAPPMRPDALHALTGGTVVIRNQRHRVYAGLNVSTASGDCVDVTDSYDVTIERSQIGPCGGNGINVSGGGKIRVYDSYVHPETLAGVCCDSNDAILLQGTSNVYIQGNVVAYGESNVWNQYPSVACGPVTVAHNVATEIRESGAQSGFWDGGGCDPVTLVGNTWDEAARKLLTPVRKKLPPPLIPPRPHACVIQSPYSNQTKWPPCGSE